MKLIKIFNHKKALAWFLLIPMVVPLWILMFGQIKLLFVDWGDIMNKLMIIGGIITIVLVIFRNKNK